MPMHDWSRVDAGVYHHFHQRWAISICDSLNAGLLPPGYSALVEQHAGRVEPDVLAVERRPKRRRQTKPGDTALLTQAPQTRHVFRTAIDAYTSKGNRIAIHHPIGEIVCVIEVVSPGNKHSRVELRRFVEKAANFLRSGVHLLIVDPFPPTVRDPQGIHKAIFDEIEETNFELSADDPLTLAAYETSEPGMGLAVTAYVEPFRVGVSLPDMPAYLDQGEYVRVPLEAAYQSAWQTCPADMRELVETGLIAGEEFE